jgi:Na+/phosphate symporter
VSSDAVKILAEYGLPSLLLGLVSYAFFVFLKKHDAQAAQQVRECHNIVKAKDKEIARLHEARLAEQKEAIERVAKIANNALSMAETLASLTESEFIE